MHIRPLLSCKMLCALCAMFLGSILMLTFSTSGVNLFYYPGGSNNPYSEVPLYVVVFDGGSTGSRMHVFRFCNSTGQPRLTEEHFTEIRPGLSSYAHEPSEAANSLEPLVEKAKALIPPEHWDTTPIVLKATAGLRLLSARDASSILEEVSRLFSNAPFQSDKHSAAIMDGIDEGLYGWFTINFLLNQLKDLNDTVATLDLGGGSTQVTFSVGDQKTLNESPSEYILKRNIRNQMASLYTHSYLGQGLMSARHSILSLTSHSLGSKRPTLLESPCIADDTVKQWVHAGQNFTVVGHKSKKYSFKECYKLATQFLGEAIHRPAELKDRPVCAVSYYYDRAFDMGLIDELDDVTTLKVSSFLQAADKACSTSSSKHPFLCLDLSYISALLHHGLGFSEEKEIMLLKKYSGIETSWALGAAFSLLS